MNSDPLVSIILPTYNGSRYLDQAIQSCVRQTFANWELIIVDDASIDSTPFIIEKWIGIDRRIRTVRHQTNRKLPASLNTGFSLAEGEYLTWTSDDNEYLPSALDEMVNFLVSHPGVDIVYTDYTEIDESGAPVRKVDVLPPQDLVFKGDVVGASFLYKRAVQEKLSGYAEDLFLAEDYDFWIRAAASFRLEPLHRNCYLYRLHASSLTSAQYDRVRTAIAKTIIQNLPVMSWLSQERKALVCLDFGLHLFELGQIADARLLFEYAFLQYQLLSSNHDYTLHRLLYHLRKLRPEKTLVQLVDLLPDRDLAIRAFKKHVWSQYHGAMCFESYLNNERSIARYHFPKALLHSLHWLRNAGLLRIAIWAYTGLVY